MLDVVLPLWRRGLYNIITKSMQETMFHTYV